MSFIKNNPILIHILLLSSIFAASHMYALYFALYWTTAWFDVYMHFFGGVLGSLMTIYFLYKIGISPVTIPQKIFLFLFIVVSVFAVAVVWELWEIYVGIIDPFLDFKDSIADLILGTLGAVVGFVYYDKKLRAKE
jgi:hypothetical protein